MIKSILNWLATRATVQSRDEELERFCRAEYGNEWMSAYSSMRDIRTQPTTKIRIY
jgi:hypothetical protein